MTDAKVPSKDYRRQYRELLPTLMPELERMFGGDDPVLGEAVVRFEQHYARSLSTKTGSLRLRVVSTRTTSGSCSNPGPE